MHVFVVGSHQPASQLVSLLHEAEHAPETQYGVGVKQSELAEHDVDAGVAGVAGVAEHALETQYGVGVEQSELAEHDDGVAGVAEHAPETQ